MAVPASGLRALPALRDLARGPWGGRGPRSPALAVSGFQENCAILGELVRLQAQKSRLLGFSTRADSVLEMNMAKTSQVVATFLGNPASPRELLGLTFDLEEGANVCHGDVRLYTVRDAAADKVIHRQVLPGPLPSVHAEGKSGHMACFGLQPGCLQQDGRRQIAIAAMVANFTKSTPNPPSLLQHDELETYFHEFWQAMHQLRSQGASTWQRVSGLHTFAWLRAGKKTNDKKGTLPATLATAGDENQREGSGAGSAAPCEALALLPVSVGHGQRRPPELLANSSSPGWPTPVRASPPSPSSRPPGLFNLRQIVLAKVDKALHTQTPADPAQENARLCQEVLGVPATPGTHLLATFGHLAGSYDAQSYGYLCSEVYSADTFHTRFKREGVLSGKVRGQPAMQTNTEVLGLGLDACAARLGLPGSEGPALDPLLPCPFLSHSRGGHTHTLSEGGAPPSCSPTPSRQVAMDYRSCILRPGGSEDAKGMVKLFLGCDPTQDAFLLSKGLQVEGCKPPAC
ncbi:hypothetical protein J1605_014004 [Eschrichtius robustus]|uniref:Thimet oligopeptidase n=1 Tax=Eschrichtius robustus TaxID=9764 RepID=A0AB34GG57_ESCRO|nr:hypothetical protein J1605_014004 [Eschrichtius robustus]